MNTRYRLACSLLPLFKPGFLPRPYQLAQRTLSLPAPRRSEPFSPILTQLPAIHMLGIAVARVCDPAL